MSNRVRDIRSQRAALVPSAFTLSAVAQRVGVTVNTLRSWETGMSRPRKRHLRALAKELGVATEDLGFDGDGPGDPSPDPRAP